MIRMTAKTLAAATAALANRGTLEILASDLPVYARKLGIEMHCGGERWAHVRDAVNLPDENLVNIGCGWDFELRHMDVMVTIRSTAADAFFAAR